MKKSRLPAQFLVAMIKFTCFHLFLVTLTLGMSMAGNSYSQEALSRSVTFRTEDQDFRTVLSLIEKNAKVKFSYDLAVIPAEKITFTAQAEPLSSVLEKLLKPLRLTYTVSGRYIILSKRPDASRSEGQNSDTFLAPPVREVRGKVTDEKGEALPGVSVLLKGSQKGASTGIDGVFSLEVTDEKSVLIFSFVGYISREVEVGNRAFIDISLNEDEKVLEEVVVVGFGTQRKANLTGAVSAVKMDEVLGSRPISGAAEALQGAMPGLQITSNSGRPGTTPNLNIRGINSINGGSPLVLVDNVPMDINMINPRDIESVTVLKDAAASSIYGGRAAFGVILIKTKQGAQNQPLRFDYSANMIFSRPSDLPKKVSTMQMVQALSDWGTVSHYSGQDVDTWLAYLNEYRQNPAAFPNGRAMAENGQIYPLAHSNALINEFMGTGVEYLHNLSFSGGSERSNYRVSLGYANEDGILVTAKDSYKKYNLNSFITTNLARNLTGSVNVQYTYDDRKTPSNLNMLFTRATIVPAYAPTGMHTFEDGTQIPYYTPANIIKGESPVSNFGDLMRAFGKLEYKPLEGLKITGEYTFQKSSDNTRNPTSTNRYVNNEQFNLVPLNAISSYLRSHSNTNYHALNIYANYERTLGANHHINILAGTNRESSSTETFNVRRDELMTIVVPSISTSMGVIAGGDSFGEFATLGYFSRLNYNFKERYLLELNGRFDGSSRFAREDRFGFFPSMSAGWIASEEGFMQGLKPVLNQLKIRGSFGRIGNQAIADLYPSIPGLSTYNASWLNLETNIRYLSLNPPQLISAGFTWETVQTANVGVDLSFLSGKLNSSFDLFRRRTLNMLTKGAELPASLGTTAPLQNVADLESKGWEWDFVWKDRIAGLSYSLGFNLSDNRGFITRFDNASGLLSDYYVGQEIGEIWGYTTQGYFTVNDFVEGTLDANLMSGTLKEGIAGFRGVPQNPGDIRYVDRNGDGEIFSGNNTLSDPGDRSVIGNNSRRYQYGVYGNAAFRGFDFSFFIQGIGKRDQWIMSHLFWPYGSVFTSFYEHQMDYWTPDNPDGYYPRRYANAGNAENSQRVQTKYLSNGAYMRLKNVTVGYSLPEKLLSRLSLKRLRMFVTGENMLNLKHTPDGIDPEVSDLGSGLGYPFLKKYSFGLDLSF